ncbi:hypothetical protein OG455_39040 [Kitasatospora sp. NBC_01287]|uniref:hypothetical protein n=1 Tax=Kitasatospora sp. NBC_01287 TaxID=2903573 RepID=UPI00224FB7D3|nr:hypothetical protein [Kitasatospora sp. NBC_01287]MCX4751432.1 hypothetical protein [Kitasatospora sp. NBC_01287]
MPPKKKTAPGWQEVPGAQDVMARAVPLAAVARETRSYAPLAEAVFDAALLFTNSDGLPDLRRESGPARQWMSDLLDTVGLKAPPQSSLESRREAERARQSLAQSVREALSSVRVAYIRQLDEQQEERERRFPGLSSSEEVFAYYKIVPKAQREIRAETYKRRVTLQSIGAAVLSDDEEVPAARCAEVVHSMHRTVAALAPASFAGLDAETTAQLREEIQATRAALLVLERALS